MRPYHTFRSPIPSSRHILSVRTKSRSLLDESKIRNFHLLFDAVYQNVLWLEISMEEAIFMHV